MNKKHTHPESKLADRGWEDMQRILDREMPKERRRRPLFWFFWGAAALLGAGITAWWLWTGSAADSPVIPKNKAVVSEQPIAGVKEKRQTSISTPAPANNPAGTLSPSGVRAETAIPKNAGNTPQPELAVRNSTSNALPFDEFAAPDNSHSAAITKSQTTDSNTPSATDASLSARIINPGQALPFLPTRNSVLSTRDTPHSQLRPEYSGHSALRTRNSALAFAGYAAAHLNPSSGALAPSAGLLADWRWSRRFGLRTGIGYQFEHFQMRHQPGTILSETAYLGITGDQRVLDNNTFNSSGPVVGSSSVRNVLVPVSAIHRLEMPVQVFWQALPRWRAYAGVQLQYAFRANGTGSVIELDSSRVLNLASPALTNRLASEQTRGWTTYLSGGFSYQFNRHLELALQYHWTPDFSLQNRLNFESLDASGGNIPDVSAERYDHPTTAISRLQLQAIWKF